MMSQQCGIGNLYKEFLNKVPTILLFQPKSHGSSNLNLEVQNLVNIKQKIKFVLVRWIPKLNLNGKLEPKVNLNLKTIQID